MEASSLDRLVHLILLDQVASTDLVCGHLWFFVQILVKGVKVLFNFHVIFLILFFDVELVGIVKERIVLICEVEVYFAVLAVSRAVPALLSFAGTL